MPLWGLTDQADNAPKYAISDHATANGETMYANVTPDQFVTGVGVGVIGANTTEVAANTGLANPGWVLQTRGTGPISNGTINAAGTGYTNGDIVTVTNGTSAAILSIGTNATGNATSLTVVSGGAGFLNATAVSSAVTVGANTVNNIVITTPGGGYTNGDILTISNGTINATATITTNAAGNVASVVITQRGRGFISNTGVDTAVTNSTGGATSGTDAVFAPKMGASTTNGASATFVYGVGGRAGRVHQEVLVSASTIS